MFSHFDDGSLNGIKLFFVKLDFLDFVEYFVLSHVCFQNSEKRSTTRLHIEH